MDATDANISPEYEKQGLLPERPPEDGMLNNSREGSKRPADVWLPAGSGYTRGRAESLDFTITSRMRADDLHKVLDAPEEILTEYEHFKRNCLDTAAKCIKVEALFSRRLSLRQREGDGVTQHIECSISLPGSKEAKAKHAWKAWAWGLPSEYLLPFTWRICGQSWSVYALRHTLALTCSTSKRQTPQLASRCQRLHMANCQKWLPTMRVTVITCSATTSACEKAKLCPHTAQPSVHVRKPSSQSRRSGSLRRWSRMA